MTDEDGMRACELEEEYAELGGWEAESDASRILQGLGIGTEYHTSDMATLDARLKVKVLLAQALFGNPDILMTVSYTHLPGTVRPALRGGVGHFFTNWG